MKYTDYVNLKYRPKRSDIICSFYVEPARGVNIKKASGAVASESSVGTWTDVTQAPKRIDKLAAKVFSIRGNYIKIAYPCVLFETSNVPQILSSIAGNIFGMKIVKNLKLLDIEFPENIIKAYRGPRFGVKGVRKILGVKRRPLLGTIIKPKLGLNEKEHARMAYNAWIGGCDIVKDDENLSSQSFNKFLKRVSLTLKARELAEKITGEKKVYMPNVTSETKEMLRRARFVKRHHGRYVMVDIITCGWSALQTLREENQDLKLVLHAHRAGYAAMTRDPKHGMTMLVIAKLCRLIGLDQLHIGTIVGKMATPKREVVDVDQEMEKKVITQKPETHILEQRWYHIKSVFAVCSGGLHPGHIPYLVKQLGKNIIIQMGGGIHGHPFGTFAGAKAARQAISAVMEGKSLKEYSKKHLELRKALEFFE
jgi:ribulose-bisphosphate carboxylase large chain